MRNDWTRALEEHPKFYIGLFTVGLLLLTLFTSELICRFLYIRHLKANPVGDLRVVSGSVDGEFVEPTPATGYRLRPNAQVEVEASAENNIRYRVRYETDEFSRRITPTIAGPKTKHLVSWGCSYTFGEGISGEETLTAQLTKRLPDYQGYNYGHPGWGTSHVVARMETLGPNEIKETAGLGIYLFIEDHIARSVGSLRTYRYFYGNGPHFKLDKAGGLIRLGNFDKTRPIANQVFPRLAESYTLNYFNWDIYPWFVDANQLTIRLVERAKELHLERFPTDKFVVLFYPGSGKEKIIKAALEKDGVETIDLSAIPNLTSMVIPKDGHPTGAANALIADFVVSKLNP